MRAPVRAVSLPPPVGGWDALSALAQMPPQNAVRLDNWFPEADRVRVRRGYTAHATGFTSAVETLMVYEPQTANGRRLFAAAGSGIYDATNSGPIGSPVVSGLTSARWQHVQMTTPGGHFLLAFNGADAARIYDGTSWATASISGPTATALVWGNLHQRRLWVGEINSLVAWYLPPNAISGTASLFDLRPLASLGGHLVGMGTWTRDAGDGQDDVAVFLTSQGEVFVYVGTDPASANTWALEGVFRIGKPLGRRAMLRAGADLIVMTEDGFVLLSEVIGLDRVQQRAGALTRLIDPEIAKAARLYGSNFGWCALLYPRRQMAIFNVPVSSGAHQYVFNTVTRAACRFTGLDAKCWALLNDDAFFGTATAVMKWDVGTSDNGAEIRAVAIQAPSGFGSRAQKGLFRRVQVIMESESPPKLGVDIALDYRIYAPLPAPTTTAASLSLWDSALWDTALWAGEAIFDDWRAVQGIGRTAALRVVSESATTTPAWIGSNVLFVPGGTL